MTGISAPILRTVLNDFFVERQCRHFGTAFLRAYRTLNDGERFLDSPTEYPVNTESVGRILALIPLGRALSTRDLGERKPGDGIAALSDTVVGVLNRTEWDTARFMAATIASYGLNAMPNTLLAKRLHLVLANIAFPFDCAGIIRAARLVAKARGFDEVDTVDLAATCLLLLPKAAWEGLKRELRIGSAEYSTLERLYGDARVSIEDASGGCSRTLWTVALYARDELVPLPSSGRIADVRPTDGICIEWPVESCLLLPDPTVEGMPVVGPDTILSTVLLPTAKLRGLALPSITHCASGLVLHDCVGTSSAFGGWQAVLERVVDRASSAVLSEALAALFPAKKPSGTAMLREVTYDEILHRLRSRVRGNDAVLRELALMCDARLSGVGAPVRALLIGPPGCGKTTMLSALAEASGRVFVRIDASQLTEHGWTGLQVSDVAAMIWRAAGGDAERASRAIVLLDEFDKQRTVVRLPGKSDDSEGAKGDYGPYVRAGRQEAMLGLMDTGDSVITFTTKDDASKTLQLPTRGLVIVAAGAFRGIQMAGDVPSDEELVQYGFIEELVSRIGTRLCLQAPGVDALCDLFTHGPDAVVPATAMCKAMGYSLTVAPQAVRMVARAVAEGRSGLTPRTGAAMIMSASRSALLAAMDREDGNTDLLVGPDDLTPRLAMVSGAIRS